MVKGERASASPAALLRLSFADAHAWSAWLRKHHESSTGLWLQLAKKGARVPSVTYAEALEEALCWGWIDGQRAPFDAEAWLQRFTPRGPRSIWSKINRDKAEALIASGRMQPAGHAAIAQAKENGRWEAAYDSQRSATVPTDLEAALEANPRAKTFFAGLDSANRYAILFRLHHATRPETRARKLHQYVEMLAKGERLHR
jgi:uncharacterized protein YdeI (YjbR/CyaY-like superfamily)